MAGSTREASMGTWPSSISTSVRVCTWPSVVAGHGPRRQRKAADHVLDRGVCAGSVPGDVRRIQGLPPLLRPGDRPRTPRLRCLGHLPVAWSDGYPVLPAGENGGPRSARRRRTIRMWSPRTRLRQCSPADRPSWPEGLGTVSRWSGLDSCPTASRRRSRRDRRSQVRVADGKSQAPV
jgi:hypothetical protein